ncbi:MULTISPECIES: hypothetical protein [unclassified Xanthomonas]|uniref:hypothetical protein n=1 Tax=Xanthomonas sp. LMG 8992 TaxID=1591157 RepID=UPI00136CABF0|nr:hypothetical protein [Xanthomonas sp. LMG 8992]
MLFAVLKEPLVRQRLFLCLTFVRERGNEATTVPVQHVSERRAGNDTSMLRSRECRAVVRR